MHFPRQECRRQKAGVRESKRQECMGQECRRALPEAGVTESKRQEAGEKETGVQEARAQEAGAQEAGEQGHFRVRGQPERRGVLPVLFKVQESSGLELSRMGSRRQARRPASRWLVRES